MRKLSGFILHNLIFWLFILLPFETLLLDIFFTEESSEDDDED